MKIQFYGAAKTVTGSCHILHINGKTVLLDCGLYQGKGEKVFANETFDFNPKEVDYVILSHAHIDHSGRVPLLYKMGFKGEVLSTQATMDLCSIMLPDSGHIHESEVDWKNKKRKRQGLKTLQPLYTFKLAELSLSLFRAFPYDEMIDVFDGLKIRFRDAGHLLGSAIIELYMTEKDQEEVKLVYSGDLGNLNKSIIKDPTIINHTDYLIIETTYGSRVHPEIKEDLKVLLKIIKETFARGGNVIIPSFAVGRTQEILYELNKYVENEDLKDIKVYIDSPLAIQATKVFESHNEDYDNEAKELVMKGEYPFRFDGLRFSVSANDSMEINKIQSNVIVISASGMCDAGRIKHHLKYNLWREESSIVFVGYQAEGTLGRNIVGGAKTVKIFGEQIAVKAHIYNLEGLSGHADRSGLFNWIEGFMDKPKEILLVHGDKEAQDSFKQLLESKGYSARIVESGEEFYINEKANKVNKIEKTYGTDKAYKTYKADENLRKKLIKDIKAINNIEGLKKVDLLDIIKDIIYDEKEYDNILK
ncbi:MBL fold metallo-hydrolase [Clostridium estertheticum]|uniref:MBL fold metallo-hydrolase RNA specificity domain-containing protein n=1 Tax=Clostridium estertheticum TaxID=238834 RepID=UPI001CF544F4|nr:MBL fold metallo-hydrolase [Clostridium estertheticum]MCB2307078.1 MBL fold metallo-hydrolase [Clostridium estertheticum]MCB2345887.1 MBL fold metallo-hydrolase [Clostridium estertheticum]MCB2350522.1 MBL fold metallo-hydrolase [Clostridium estertheticum]WAG45431.1 MBL fold metallo-hydrolase [Clostridium estertheticum]